MTPPQRRQAIDPAVADLLGNMERRQSERALPAKERKAKAKERAKTAKRNRVMVDLPEEIQNHVAGLANELGCTFSQALTALVIIGAVQDGITETLRDYRKPGKGYRYDYNLDISEMVKILNFAIQGTPLAKSKGHPIDK